ncbi:response regulator transcription factor [Phycicoccus sp. SLBN-51]|uniref:LuxR C-terminal-related transcriptional regulator n=1 Tax=Phycicoccus sp. SLBN-51 TaxID=2768447 RepID=UPI00117208FF|nr:response regulator transcription factor [Phycicoccus sp. SLBN-51]TQJ50265.1 LuxR family two component transcriptional regulator [Phycicoccus sp. SLBN-51]
MPAAEVLRVVVADESCSFRDGLGFLLRTGGVEVVSSVGELPSLLESVDRHAPDVVVVEADLPASGPGSGVAAVLRLKAEQPLLGCLVVADDLRHEHVLALLDGAGPGSGYLLKGTERDVLGLLDALWRVARGGLALSPEVVESMVAAHRASAPLAGLGQRDLQVLTLVAEGRSNAGIAEALRLSRRTTDHHVSDLLRDLGVEHDGTDYGRAVAALALLRS